MDAMTPNAVEGLLRRATHREPIRSTDSKSGVSIERVVVDGQRYVVKHLHCDDDWIARATGDLIGRAVQVCRSGILEGLPGCIDHVTVSATSDFGRHGWGAVLVLHDVGDRLVEDGPDPVPLEQHRRFLSHMAALHAAYWGFEDRHGGLMPLAHRYLFLGPSVWPLEVMRPDGGTPVARLAPLGWQRFQELEPAAAAIVLPLVSEPWPLVEALAATPATFLHGDWKLTNLGSHPDGRTILLDWGFPGQGPPCVDLAWYLAVNGARLPEAPDDAIGAYRKELETAGVSTGGWWDRQLALALLGATVQLGWDKALHGQPAELGWWAERATLAASYLIHHRNKQPKGAN